MKISGIVRLFVVAVKCLKRQKGSYRDCYLAAVNPVNKLEQFAGDRRLWLVTLTITDDEL